MDTKLKELNKTNIPQLMLQYFKHHYTVEFFNSQLKFNEDIAKKSYQLRHQVYCEELGFESSNYSRCETDLYDANSAGCLISTKISKEPIASVRLIQQIDKTIELPCLNSFRREHPEEYNAVQSNIETNNYAEISRLLILNDFRSKSSNNDHNPLTTNYLLLSLFASTMILSENLDSMLFMCETKMLALFKKIGFPFHLLSQKRIHHKGVRVLIKIIPKEALLYMHTDNPHMKTIVGLIQYMQDEKPLKLFESLSYH